MAVLTISREVGSRGTYIGQRVAAALDYRFADKEIIDLILRDYRLQIDLRGLYASGKSLLTRFDPNKAVTLDLLNKAVLALARCDNMVILGRGGYAVLQGFTDVLNVRVQAPFDSRVPRMMETFDITDQSEAERRLQDRDRQRATFVESSYRLRWDDCSAFNLVIDTSSIDPDKAVIWLVEAIEALQEQDLSGGRTTRSIAANPVLERAVAECLPDPHAIIA